MKDILQLIFGVLGGVGCMAALAVAVGMAEDGNDYSGLIVLGIEAFTALFILTAIALNK